MKFSVGHAQHIGLRSQQQDRLAVAQEGDSVVALVADGMGGMAHGDKAAETASQAFLAAWKSSGDTAAEERLTRCAEAANAAVYELAGSMNAVHEMGTTLVAAAVSSDCLQWVSVGDSAVFLLRGGELRQLNVFHNYGRELEALADRGIVPHEIVRTHPEREALTSFVGMESIRLLDRSSKAVALEPGDWVLLSSDGLFKTLNAAQIAGALSGDPQKACENLVRQTIAAREAFQDNVTVVAIAAGQESGASTWRSAKPLFMLATAMSAAGAALWTLRRKKD